jgi:HK97 family phage major capsid protein
VDERTSLTEIATRMADTAATENRDLTEPERAEMTRMETRCAELDGQIANHNGQLESARAYASLVERIESNTAPRVPEQRSLGSARPVLETTSPGQAFVDSDEFRSYRGSGSSGRFQIADYIETRAPITTANLAIPHTIVAPVAPEYRPTLVDMVNHVRVSSGVVDWVVVGPDPTAAVVAEGAAKPEAAATFTPAAATGHPGARHRHAPSLDDASCIGPCWKGSCAADSSRKSTRTWPLIRRCHTRRQRGSFKAIRIGVAHEAWATHPTRS